MHNNTIINNSAILSKYDSFRDKKWKCPIPSIIDPQSVCNKIPAEGENIVEGEGSIPKDYSVVVKDRAIDGREIEVNIRKIKSNPTNYDTTKSSVIVLKSLLELSSLKKISEQRKIFCKSRIEMVLRHLYPSIFFSKSKELNILSQYIYKNINLFLLLKKYNQENGLDKIISENKKDSLIKCKKIIEMSTISKIHNLKGRNFYIFCLDRNSYALSKILLKHKFKIKGFLDNNIELKDRDKTNMNFLPAREWLKRIKNDDKNYLIICNQRKEHVLQILSQVIKSGFSKNRIFIKSFNLNLKEKLKTNNEY